MVSIRTIITTNNREAEKPPTDKKPSVQSGGFLYNIFMDIDENHLSVKDGQYRIKMRIDGKVKHMTAADLAKYQEELKRRSEKIWEDYETITLILIELAERNEILKRKEKAVDTELKRYLILSGDELRGKYLQLMAIDEDERDEFWERRHAEIVRLLNKW